MPPTTTPLLHEGRYSIEQEFNLDGSRTLFQAYDIKQEEPVSIIEVPVGFARVATASQREAAAGLFQEQAARLAAFRHKSAVAVRECFVEAGRHYLVTDPVGGTDLSSVMSDQHYAFSLDLVTGWADTILDVLNGLHTFRPPLVYKNIRPDCFVVREDGSAVLTLFGMIDSGAQSSPATGAGTGTIAYSPLEQIWGGLDAASQKVIINKLDEASEKLLKQDLDARSDIYSLGASLYHLITGRTPVDALERSIEMIEDNPDPLQAPHKVDPAVPVEVSDVIMKAMEIRREYRFDSAAIMRQVLKTALVRVKERLDEEARDEQEALEALRGTATAPAKPAGPETERIKPDETPVAAPGKTENMPLGNGQPGKASKSETFELSDLEDDLLGLMAPSPHTSTPPHQPAPVTAASVAIDVKTPVQSIDAVAAPAVQPEPVTQPEPIVETVEVVDAEQAADATMMAETDEPETVAETTAKNGAQTETDSDPKPSISTAGSFSTDEGEIELYPTGQKKSSTGLIAAAAAAVICIAAVGGWLFMSSGSSQPPAAAAPQPAVIEQPVKSQEPVRSAYQQPEPSPGETAVTEPTPAPADEPVPQDQPQRAAVPQPARQKKAPAKAPAQKKAVTVDDLINDN